MKIYAELSKTGDRRGQVWAVDDDGYALTERFRALGEADNARASEADNEAEDPKHPFGDHPVGTCRITEILHFNDVASKLFDTYGPLAFLMDALGGEALKAKENGRTGIWIHGGKLNVQGGLRATYGCLRVDDSTMFILAELVERAIQRGESVIYEAMAV